MSRENLYSAINPIVPLAHMAWAESTAPSLPWAVYYLEEMSSFHADGCVFADANRWVVELYQKTCDPELEAAIEAAIIYNFGPYTKSEAWVESENCMQTAYSFTEIERN